MKARSPSHPSIGLAEAIDKAALIYKRDYQNHIPRAVAVTHMGYNSLNGKSLGVLGALLKFGLLEGRGDQTRISDLAVQIIAYEPGTQQRSSGIITASAEPELFRELDDRFQNGKASDAAIRSYLLTRKFIPAGADTVVRTYRATKQLVEAESHGYSVDGQHEQSAPMSEAGPPVQTQASRPEQFDTPAHGTRRVVFDLAEGDAVLQVPDDLSPESVGDLEGYLEVFLKKARRSAGLPPKAN